MDYHFCDYGCVIVVMLDRLQSGLLTHQKNFRTFANIFVSI